MKQIPYTSFSNNGYSNARPDENVQKELPQFTSVGLWTSLKLTVDEVMFLSLYLTVRREGFYFGSMGAHICFAHACHSKAFNVVF